MSFNRDERPSYAIGIIIDNSVTNSNGVKIQNIVDTVNSLVEIKNQELGDFILKGISPEIKVKTYIIVGRKIPKAIKDKITVLSTDSTLFPAFQILWADEQEYSYTELEARLRRWLSDTLYPEKVWVIDINSDTTGDILSKFI